MEPDASELEFVKTLVAEAATFALARAGSLSPQLKANASYVTDLDLDLETRIRGRLRDRFPDDAITGEEHAPEGPTGPRRWSIDPIDGTGNLVHALPLWAVSVGLVIADEPTLGVIAIPPLGELYWATKGQGAWRDGQRLQLDDDQAEFRSHENLGMTTNALRRLRDRSIPGRIRTLGASCCDQAFLASGRLRAAVFLGEHHHDLAAGVVIVSEAGGRFADLAGNPLSATEALARTPLREPLLMGTPGRIAALARRLARPAT